MEFLQHIYLCIAGSILASLGVSEPMGLLPPAAGLRRDMAGC